MTQPNFSTIARRYAMRTPPTVIHTTPSGEPVEIPAHVRSMGVVLEEPTLAQALAFEVRHTVRDTTVPGGSRVVWQRYGELSDDELQQESAYHRTRFDRSISDASLRTHYRCWRGVQLVLASRALAAIIATRGV